MKAKGNNNKGKFVMRILNLGLISLPKEFIGKKVRLKLFVIEVVKRK